MLMNRNLSHFPLVPFYSLGGVRDGGGGASEDPLFHKSNEDAQGLLFSELKIDQRLVAIQKHSFRKKW